MKTTIKYEIEELRTGQRDTDDKEVTIVKARNKETNQVCQFIDMELSSMRLGDELRITIKNKE